VVGYKSAFCTERYTVLALWALLLYADYHNYSYGINIFGTFILACIVLHLKSGYSDFFLFVVLK